MTAAITAWRVPRSTLVPVRVDVVSDDRSLRIVDTLLLDPTCWPVPLYHPLEDAIQENAAQLAYSILSDAEVQSMGRTVRHFTNRQDLWTPRLQELTEQQLRPQLLRIATDGGGGGPDLSPTRSPTAKEDGSDDDNATTPSSSSLVPISIRLMLHRMVIHEDVYWDVHGSVTPMDFAQDMVREYNLPEEAAVSIVTTVLEQLYGLPMDQSPDPTVVHNIATPARGAWLVDAKEKASNDSLIAAHHRSV
jgi:hypothetical protein